jgi:hypothetical protein
MARELSPEDIQSKADRAEGIKPEPEHPGGRPSKYQSTFASQAAKLCDLGATDEDLADFFSVSVRTIARWKSQHEEFCQALKGDKAQADDRVERSLYQRAVGYTYDSEEVRVLRDGTVVRVPTRTHVPPDTTAMIFWLKNRRPDLWRDKHEVEHTHRLSDMSDDDLARIASGSSEGAASKKVDPPVAH